jgi:Domain of unknown function (DUF5659)
MSDAQSFSTSDYGQAAFLIARGFDLVTTKPKGNEVFFEFSSTSPLVLAISDYSSNAPIPCRDFFHALRKVKALIRENTNGNRTHRR